MLPKPLLLALAYRSVSLLFPQTYFQPDEYWQSLEVAHEYVFGYGFLTWEWRDLPEGGRLRGWIWPGVFVIIYRFLQITGLDKTDLIVFMPRVVGVFVAAVTDWAIYRLSHKLLGPGSAAGAFFLSTTNTFHAHALTRSLSNAPETMLTTLALVYFPLRPPTPASDPLQGGRRPRSTTALSSTRSSDKPPVGQKAVPHEVGPSGELDYVAMDRGGPDFDETDINQESFVMAVFFASLAICIRPTTVTFWGYLGIEYLLRQRGNMNPVRLIRDWIKGALTAIFVLACSTLIDYQFTGKVYFALWHFVKVNMYLSSFFGATTPVYHLTTTLPIFLFPIWYWWGQGFIACLLPRRFVPARLRTLDAPEGMRSLARGLAFAIFTLSLSPHSEWRFLHPFLPSLLLFALPPLFKDYTPTIFGAYRFREAVRQYVRFPKRAFYLILLAPIPIYIIADCFLDRAHVDVMSVLRRGELGDVTGFAIIMDCHATPFQSHLHTNVPNWWLTCDPPLDRHIDRGNYKNENQLFYLAPLASFDKHMNAYADLHRSTGSPRPSHIVAYDALIDMGETETSKGGPTIRDRLIEMGYREVWYGWSLLDRFHPDKDDRGGLRVWSTDTTVKSLS